MEGDGARWPLGIHVPVSEGFWRNYGVALAGTLVVFSGAAVVLARELGDGLVVGATIVGLSIGAVLTGLVVYNVVVAALLAR